MPNPKPAIDLYFYPVLTLKARSAVDATPTPQAVACLGISSDLAAFSQLAKVVWQAALRCYLKQTDWPPPFNVELIHLGAPYPSRDGAFGLNGNPIDNNPGLRENLRMFRTLARSTNGSALDFDTIVKLLRANFDFQLRGVLPDDAKQTTAFFPVFPGLRLQATKEALDVDFRTTNLRDSSFEDRLDDALSQFWVRGSATPPQLPPGAARPAVSFATLVFEQYLDRLCSAVNQLYYDFLKAHGGSMALGDLLNGPQIVDFQPIAGLLSNDLHSGLRLPSDFDAVTGLPTGPTAGFFEWIGQQFSIQHDQPDYPIAIVPDAATPADWVHVQTDGDPSPAKTLTIDSVLVQQMVGAPPPFALQTLEPLSPLQANGKHFVLSQGQTWTAPDGTQKSVQQLSVVLRRQLSDLASELADKYPTFPDRYQLIQLSFFPESANNEPSSDAGPNASDALTDLTWATVIPLAIRQVVQSTTPSSAGSPGYIANYYELVGMSEDQRRLLDDIVNDSPANPPSVVSVLYPSAPGGWKSDALSTDPTSCQCMLLRTNLTTESAPPPPSVMDFLAVAPPAQSDIAPIGDSVNFLRLVEQACIVNSGGYFLYYNPGGPVGDPLAALFAAGNSANVAVTVLVQFGPVGAKSSPRPYFNSVVGPAVTDSSATGTPYVYAIVSRATLQSDGSLKYDDLEQYDVQMPPGCVGFRGIRNRLADPGEAGSVADRASFYLDSLFSRLSYNVTVPTADFQSFPFTLPVSPIVSHKDAGSKPWTWDHVLQVAAKPFVDPYAGIGQQIMVQVAFRDIFGNEFPPTHGPTQVQLPVLYYDSLVPLSGWPGLRTEFDIAAESGGLNLVVRLPIKPYPDNSTADQQSHIHARYLQILQQLNDPRARAVIRVGNAAGTMVEQDCLAVLQNLAGDAASMAIGDPSTIGNYRMVLGKPAFGDTQSDFFQLSVDVKISREGDDSLFAKVQPPWESAPLVHEPVRAVNSSVGLPGAIDGLHPGDPNAGLLAFAAQFEQLYATENLVLATGVDAYGSHVLWILRSDHVLPMLVHVTPSAQGVDLVYAPKPLSTELISDKLPSVPPPLPDSSPPSARTYTEVDLDAAAADFFAAVERFLAPENVSAIICGTTPESPTAGRDQFQNVMTSKRTMSNRGPELLLDKLFVNSPAPSNCSLTTAQTAYRQCLLESLNAVYGIDTILQFNAMVPSALSCNRLGNGVALIGTVLDATAGAGPHLVFRNDKIRYRPDLQAFPPRISVLVEQPTDAVTIQALIPLSFQWTHLEIYDQSPLPVPACGAAVDFAETKWLTLLRPKTIPIDQGNGIDIPIPRREFPLVPHLKSHRGRAQANPTTVRDARDWIYDLFYESAIDELPGEPVDQIELAVDLNAPASQQDALVAPGSTLFASLMYFEAAVPDPDAFFATLRATHDPQWFDRLGGFAKYVGQVANAYSVISAGSVAAFSAASSLARSSHYTVQETAPSSGNRMAQISWSNGDDDLRATIGPVPGPTSPPTSPLSYSITFAEPTAPNTWHSRQISIWGLDLLRYETAVARARVVRNRWLSNRPNPHSDAFAVNPSFIYVTAETRNPAPVAPRLIVNDPIPITSNGGSNTLCGHLQNLFADLFADISADPPLDKRHLRMEVRYQFEAQALIDPAAAAAPWQAAIPVTSPHRLLPPQAVVIAQVETLIDTTVASLTQWQTDFDPDPSGRLLFDLQIYSCLSAGDNDKPLLRLSQLTLDLAQITSWPA